jgi:acetyl-CoA C-acetyltransferase
MPDSYLIAAARTPIGGFRGAFNSITAPQLGAAVIREVLLRSGLSATEISEVIMGNVLQAGVGQAPARQAALQAGLPPTIAALTINKVCGSGLKSVMLADQAIRAGDASAIIAGGMESMSGAPHILSKARDGFRLGDVKLRDALILDGLTCAFENCHMGNHAEYIAERFQISRPDQDAYSLASQLRAGRAIDAGYFDDEIVPVTVQNRREEIVVSQDESPRPDSTIEGLAGLRPVFENEGTVTAGNASTLADGAAALAVVSESIARSSASEFCFRIRASAVSGTEPRDLFIAPVLAVREVLKRAQLSPLDIDLFEINEAFAAQMLACIQELKLDSAKLNVHGGAIALGHPIGASGARTLVTLLYAMQRRQAKLGLVSLCLGGGNAVAMIVERVVH